MLEFEFNTPVETANLVEFFARCGWTEAEAGTKLEWALAAADDWVLCKLDGEIIGFGRACRLSPLNRVVFDVMVDSRFRGHGLKSEIVRLLSENAGSMEKVSIFSEVDSLLREDVLPEEDAAFDDLPRSSANTYLGRTQPRIGRPGNGRRKARGRRR